MLPIIDVETRWNLTLELLERAYRSHEFTCDWRKNPKYNDYLPLFTTQDEWTVAKFVMEVLRPFQYWTLWMSKRHTVTLHHVITVYNDMFDHMDGVIRALAKKKTTWKQELFFAVKCAWHKLSIDYTEVPLMTGMILVSAYILDPSWKVRSFMKWDKGMDINTEYEASYTTQYKEPILKYVENENCAKHRHLPVIGSDHTLNNNFSPFEMASRSGQFSADS
jgi:hypothetical protein